MPFDLRVQMAIASGIALAVLGIAVAIRRARRRSTLLFAAFAICWGAQIVVANMARGTDEISWLWFTFAFLPPTGLFLVGFSFLYPIPWRGKWAVAVLSFFGLVAVGAVAALALTPEMVLGGIARTSGVTHARWGLLSPLLFVGPFYWAFSASVLRLLSVWRRQESTSTPARWVVAGLLLFTSYANVRNLRLYATRPSIVSALEPAVVAASVIIFCTGVAVTATAIIWILRTRKAASADGLLLASAILPATVAGAEWVAIAAGAPEFETLGLWRLGTVAMIAYGIMRYQLFDIDLRIKWGLSRGAVAACIAGAFFVGAEYLEKFVPGNDALLGILTAGAISLAMRPLRRLSIRLVDRLLPGVEASHAYLRRRKLEVYQMALTQSASVGRPADDRFLAHLRNALGLAQQDVRAAERLAAPARRRGKPAPA